MGTLTFIVDTDKKDPGVKVAYTISPKDIKRMLDMFQDYYGPVPVKPDDLDKGLRPRTEEELLRLWISQTMQKALSDVKNYEERVAIEKARASVPDIEIKE